MVGRESESAAVLGLTSGVLILTGEPGAGEEHPARPRRGSPPGPGAADDGQRERGEPDVRGAPPAAAAGAGGDRRAVGAAAVGPARRHRPGGGRAPRHQPRGDQSPRHRPRGGRARPGRQRPRWPARPAAARRRAAHPAVRTRPAIARPGGRRRSSVDRQPARWNCSPSSPGVSATSPSPCWPRPGTWRARAPGAGPRRRSPAFPRARWARWTRPPRAFCWTGSRIHRPAAAYCASSTRPPGTR